MKRIVFLPAARADIRRIDRTTAMHILTSLHSLAETSHGNVKKLHDESDQLRLRVGDYRIRFTFEPPDILLIHAVRHRSEAYR